MVTYNNALVKTLLFNTKDMFKVSFHHSDPIFCIYFVTFLCHNIIFFFGQLPCIIWLVMKQPKRWSFHWIASWVSKLPLLPNLYVEYVIM